MQLFTNMVFGAILFILLIVAYLMFLNDEDAAATPPTHLAEEPEGAGAFVYFDSEGRPHLLHANDLEDVG